MTTRTISKEAAFEMAQGKAQATGSDYRVVELVDGRFAIGTQKKVSFHYPNALGWNFSYIH